MLVLHYGSFHKLLFLFVHEYDRLHRSHRIRGEATRHPFVSLWADSRASSPERSEGGAKRGPSCVNRLPSPDLFSEMASLTTRKKSHRHVHNADSGTERLMTKKNRTGMNSDTSLSMNAAFSNKKKLDVPTTKTRVTLPATLSFAITSESIVSFNEKPSRLRLGPRFAREIDNWSAQQTTNTSKSTTLAITKGVPTASLSTTSTKINAASISSARYDHCR